MEPRGDGPTVEHEQTAVRSDRGWSMTAGPGGLVRAVSAYLVSPSWAPRVASPLHDALGERERAEVLARNPDSFLHVTGVPPPGVGGAGDTTQRGALQRLLDAGAYRLHAEPTVFVYRMRDGEEEHTGVVAGVDLAGFVDGRVLGHEGVQPARVEALVAHHDRVHLRSEIVALVHHEQSEVSGLLEAISRRAPALAFTDAWGVEQAVWVAGAEECAVLTRMLEARRHYIADGHHRVAAARRRWERDGRRPGEVLLCVLYPEDQVTLHPFHRRVRGPVEVAGLVAGLEAGFVVSAATGPVTGPGSLGVYAAGSWHALTPRTPRQAPGVTGLDVTLLDEEVLRPLLGVGAGDPRLEFLPGPGGVADAQRACDTDGGVLFTLRAPQLADLVSVAERGEVMSPKTTFVKPKPRTGVFLHEPATSAAPGQSSPPQRSE